MTPATALEALIRNFTCESAGDDELITAARAEQAALIEVLRLVQRQGYWPEGSHSDMATGARIEAILRKHGK